MSALLSLMVLGAAVWFVTSLAGRAGLGNEPVDSVAQFSRAMGALGSDLPLLADPAPDPAMPGHPPLAATASSRVAPGPTQMAPMTPVAPAVRPPVRRPPTGPSATLSGWFSASPQRPRQ